MENPAAEPALLSFLKRNSRAILVVALTLIVLGILTLCGGLAYLLIARSHAVTLPEPTGDYPVGREIISWTDARPDLLVEGAPRMREYVAFVWYPANPKPDDQLAPYLPKDWATALANDQGLGALFQQDPGAVKVHAYDAVAIADTSAPYPLIIFEPGYGRIATDYTTLAEDLASHGYVVAGVTPLESAPVVVLPDGRVITRTKSGSLPETPGADITQAADALMVTWNADMRSTWTWLNTLNRDPGKWQGRLNMARTGFFGHSFGGATAVNTCVDQAECLAAADLDGTLYGPVLMDGLHKPSLFIWSQNGADPAVDKLPRGASVEVISQTLSGARHFNFTDQSLQFGPFLRLFGMLGPANPVDILQTVRASLLEFFDRQLR